MHARRAPARLAGPGAPQHVERVQVERRIAAERQAIHQRLAARAELVPKMRREIRALNPILLENFPLMGVQLYTPNATELASFEAPAKTARDAYMAKASTGEKELYKLITADLSKMRGGK